jgi:hypothetical protein
MMDNGHALAEAETIGRETYRTRVIAEYDVGLIIGTIIELNCDSR